MAKQPFERGIEALRNGLKAGNKLYLNHTGIDLMWLIEALEGKANPNPIFEGDQNPIEEVRFTGEHLEELLPYITSYTSAWKAAEELAAGFIETGVIPEELQSFSTSVLRREKVKRRQGKNLMQQLYRDLCIIVCISEMERNGYGPISKSSIDSSNICLCDVIAEIMQSFGFKRLKYEAIRSIWEKRTDLQKGIQNFHIQIRDNSIHIGYKPHR